MAVPACLHPGQELAARVHSCLLPQREREVAKDGLFVCAPKLRETAPRNGFCGSICM